MAKKTINVIYKVDDSELNEAKSTLSGLEKEAKDADKAVKDLGDEAQTSGNKAKNSFSGLGKVIAAVSFVALAKQAFDFGKQVVAITSEFQKFEAVLTNTLGSKSAAQSALAQIKAFAASTPFSVQELTASFVKLANQGFIPTREEMRKLGDLSASTGKQFDQLTEAIIDAQTGEFERLKEFGIRAQKEGDNVTFTFKGVQTQTEFTSEAIRNYVLSLGDAVGVSGSMAAISETLGGKISNMGDAWDTFLTTLGDGQKGPLKTAIENLTLLIQYATEFVETQDQARERLASIAASETVERFKGLAKAYSDVNVAKEDYLKFLGIEYDLALKNLFAVSKNEEATDKELEAANLRVQSVQSSIQAIEDYVQSQNDKAAAETHGTKVVKELTAEEKKRIENFKKANAEWDGVVDREIELARIREKIKEDQKDTGVKEELKSRQILNDSILDAEQQFAKEDADILKQNYIDKEIQEKEHAERVQEIRTSLFNSSIDLIGQLLLADNNRINEQISNAQFAANQQILQAGDNERLKAEIEIQSQSRINNLRKQQAEQEKRNIIKRILIEGSLNAVKALGLPPIPGSNFPAAGLALAQAFAQAAVTRAVGFKDGVIDLKGPGTTTSDSIPAMLSRGESVMTAAETASSMNLLKAIRERKIDDSVLTKLSKQGGSQVNVFDDSKLIKAIVESRVNVSREAYTLYETKQIGGTFKRKTRSKIQGTK